MSDAPAASEPPPGDAPSGGAPPAGERAPGPPAVDIQRLADRVYRLLQADVRLASARGQSPPGRRGRGR
jgi:hypothetical protein